MHDSNLECKKVLMFGPAFFGYRERIAEELRGFGWEVDLYDERPNNGVVCKVMLRYNCSLYNGPVETYYRGIIEANRGKDYDYVMVIKSEAINEKVFALLKEAFPNAQFILYLWDSVENVPDGEKKIRLYDRVLTFDPVDAETYGLIFRPLFFGKDYAQTQEEAGEYLYDIAFVGTAHTARPRIAKQLQQQCRSRGSDSYHYLFLPHPLVYWYNKVLNRDYRQVSKEDIHFESVSADKIRQIYSKSRSILDVEHGAQRGLTMRTIEMIGMGKKLVTTNKGIEKYDFYNPNNICIIDREAPAVDASFFETPYQPVPREILDRYSIRSFVRDIFGMKESHHGN